MKTYRDKITYSRNTQLCYFQRSSLIDTYDHSIILRLLQKLK